MNKIKKIKCFLLWLICGHSKEATGEKVQMVMCLGCNEYVFIRKSQCNK